MGRTLPTTTQIILQEQTSFARFRRALRRSDQLVLDDLFAAAHQHLAAAAYASHALPFEVMLLSMLLEEHKEVMRLRQLMESFLSAQRRDEDNRNSSLPHCASLVSDEDEEAD
jgi:hypothetical protein